MTEQELRERIAHYSRSLMAGKITPKEYDAFLEALARIMAGR